MFTSNASDVNFTVHLFVNDLGNVDKNMTVNITYADIGLEIEGDASSLVTNSAKTTDNVALIAGPISGLFLGAMIMFAVFFLVRRRAHAKIEEYFDRFALGVDGAVNTSPLYQSAKHGGENALYEGK